MKSKLFIMLIAIGFACVLFGIFQIFAMVFFSQFNTQFLFMLPMIMLYMAVIFSGQTFHIESLFILLLMVVMYVLPFVVGVFVYRMLSKNKKGI